MNRHDVNISHNSGWYLIWSYMIRHWLVYLAGISLVASGSLFMASIPRLLGQFTDRLRNGNIIPSEIAVVAGMLILISVIRVTTGWVGRVIVHRKGRILDLLPVK